MKESETPMRMVNIVNGWASRVFQELDRLAELKKNGEKNPYAKNFSHDQI